MQSQPTSPVSPVGGGSTNGQPSQLNFQDFSIIKELGRGVFGIVYLADYWGTEVAIKEVFQVQDVNFQKYYEREVGMLREARHPNCIQFMGITTSGSHSTSDQKYYIVTEYVPMGNLKQWIEDHTKELSWRLKLSFAIDIARALAYLNSRGIIHRDLKGENLLITENKRIKVCDFGLSRLIPFNEEEKKRLSFCGTDAYMAPEIILCIPFDHRIDIFSYGIILCELITRRLANGITTIKRVVPGFGIDPLELKNLAPKDTPPELINLALKCCEDDPKMRPGWKDILNVLKEVEMEIIKKEVEGKGSTSKVENIGLLDSRQANGLLRANSEDLSSGDSLCDISQQTIDTTALTIQITKTTSPSASFSGRSPTSESHSSHSAHSANSAISASSGEPVTPLTAVSEVSTTELPTWDDDGKGSHHYDVLPIPHRFTLVNHQSLLPSLVKCAVCHRRIKYQKHLVCDDCPAQVHRRCAANAPSNCGMKHGLKEYHQRYIKDLVYREQQQNSIYKNYQNVSSSSSLNSSLNNSASLNTSGSSKHTTLERQRTFSK